MNHQPLLPSSVTDPVGTDKRERACIAEFSRRLRKVRQAYVAALATIPRQVVNVTQYDISAPLLTLTLDEVGRQVDRLLLENDRDALWLIEAGVEPAYQQGAAQQLSNLSVQSATYAASRPNLTALLTSQPYQTRLGLLKARVGTALRGFCDGVKAHMSQVLQDGLAAGRGSRDIAERLAEQTGVEYRRAETITRTEVPGALRAARLQEAEQATNELGIKSLELHISACSPTTRLSHYARMGTLHTVQEQREWWATSPNFYCCKCSTVTVLVDGEGKPLTPGVVSRALKIKAANPLPLKT